MPDFLSEFLDKMRAAGFEPKGGKIIADDRWHQAACDGDKGHKFSGTYTMKVVDGTFAIGCFFSRKDPDKKYKWHSKDKDQKLDAAELKRRKKALDEAAKAKEVSELHRQQRLAAKLARVYARLPTLKESRWDHPYIARKGVGHHGARYRAKGDEAILALRDTGLNLWTIQRITPDGGKYLWPAGRKRAAFCEFGTLANSGWITVSEGWATAASIHEATQLPGVAAIDSGNLKPVLDALKKKYPLARFLICADNDAFTKNGKGDLWNVGIEKAREAAASCGGAYVTFPVFPEGNTNLTDFNDLAHASGLGEVTSQISEFMNKIPAPQPTAAPDESVGGAGNSLFSDQHPANADLSTQPPDEEEAAKKRVAGDFGMNFKVLGYNEGMYYYFPFQERQIVALSAAAHSLPNLFRLDNLDNWMVKFGSSETSEKRVVMYATNALMEMAKRRGVFQEENRVRASGAWLDEGRKILHCGDALYVDGALMDFDKLPSQYTYIASSKLMRPAAEPLSNEEAYALRQICEAPTWENKLSGSLLAGWLVIAPVCGALSYRPHLWLTGEAESGKSTILDLVIKPVLGRISVNVDYKTSEPKIRELIGYGARPVVFDEAEKSPSIEDVIGLARLSSTGGVVGKYGQKMFQALSCFCFSGINPPVYKTSDESRISFIRLKKNRRGTAIEEYNALLTMIEKTITPEFSSRLLARTLENLDSLFANISTFQKAARIVVKSARASQLIGTMLAGLYLLSRTDKIEPEAAEAWIRKYDWSNHTMIERETDPVRLLQYISGCFLRMQGAMSSREYSVGDLVLLCHKDGDKEADKLLRYHGMAVKDGRVYVASSCQHLAKLLKETDWNVKWTNMLENLEGAQREKIFYYRTGLRTSGVSLPVSLFVDTERDEPQPRLSFDELMKEIPF